MKQMKKSHQVKEILQIDVSEAKLTAWQENAYTDKYEKLLLKFRDLIQADLEIIYMNNMLQDENKQLTDYISEIKTLRVRLPICKECAEKTILV